MSVARLSGYASVFNAADENGDIVRPGAFRTSLIRRPAAAVRMLYQHQADRPIGRWTRLTETERGLYVEGEISLDTAAGREANALVRFGAVDGLSIGFRARRARARKGGRDLLAVDLWEISVVTFPMAEGARIARITGPEDDLATDMRAAARRLTA